MASGNPLLNVVFKGGRPNRYARIDDEGNLEVCNISTGSTGPWMTGGSMVNNLRIQGNVVNTASATGTGAIALGATTTASGNFSIAEGVGAISSATNAIAIGPSSQATAAGASAFGSAALAGDTNSIAIGAGQVTSITISNASASVAVGFSAVIAVNNATATAQGSIVEGTLSSITLTGAAGSCNNTVVYGPNNVLSASTGVLDNSIFIGRGQTIAAAANNWSGSICIGNAANIAAQNAIAVGANTSSTASQAVAFGNGISNTVANSVQFGTNSLEQFRLLDAATGNFSTRLVQTNNAAAASGTALTAAQALGGAFNITTAGAFNLPMPNGGTLDANAQLAGNLYVGMSFKCVITDTGAGALTLAHSGDSSTVVIGTALSAAGAARIVTFVRTGAGTWNAIAV